MDNSIREKNIIKGKVVGIRADGVYVETEDGKKGFLHISQISSRFVRNIERYCQMGEIYEFEIIGSFTNGSYQLSLKTLEKRAKQKVVRKKGRFDISEMLENYQNQSFEILKNNLDNWVEQNLQSKLMK